MQVQGDCEGEPRAKTIRCKPYFRLLHLVGNIRGHLFKLISLAANLADDAGARWLWEEYLPWHLGWLYNRRCRCEVTARGAQSKINAVQTILAFLHLDGNMRGHLFKFNSVAANVVDDGGARWLSEEAQGPLVKPHPAPPPLEEQGNAFQLTPWEHYSVQYSEAVLW